MLIRLSKCCTPVPGDEIIGFVTRGRGVSVHRADCANAASLQEGQRDRLIEVEWDSDLSGGIFVASIEVRSLDRPGLLGDVSGVLAEHKVNIIACAMKTDRDRMHAQHLRNFMFFDAPVGLMFTVDKVMGRGSLLDFGMFLQNIMLAARARGLHTCPQAAWNGFASIVLPHIGAGDNEMMVCGMALGYAEWAKFAFGAGLFAWFAIESVLLHRLLMGDRLRWVQSGFAIALQGRLRQQAVRDHLL